MDGSSAIKNSILPRTGGAAARGFRNSGAGRATGRALRAIQNAISPEKELPGTADAVGEPLKRLDGFGRRLELGTPGVRLFP